MRKIAKPNGWAGVDKNFQPYRTTGFNQNLIQNDDEEDEMICTELPKQNSQKFEGKQKTKHTKQKTTQIKFSPSQRAPSV